jgi:hypothetical protein
VNWDAVCWLVHALPTRVNAPSEGRNLSAAPRQVLAKSTPSPGYKPTILDETDTSNFDPSFTRLKAQESEALPTMDQLNAPEGCAALLTRLPARPPARLLALARPDPVGAARTLSMASHTSRVSPSRRSPALRRNQTFEPRPAVLHLSTFQTVGEGLPE